MILREFLSIWPNEENDRTVMLDVGANLGIYGLYVANLGFRVWAVEPQIQNLIKVIIECLCVSISICSQKCIESNNHH